MFPSFSSRISCPPWLTQVKAHPEKAAKFGLAVVPKWSHNKPWPPPPAAGLADGDWYGLVDVAGFT